MANIGKVLGDGKNGSMDAALLVMNQVRNAIVNGDLVFPDDPKENDGYFKVIRLHRDDIASRGYDPSGISDKEMENIADRMGDVIVENYYWDILDSICDSDGYPRIEKEDED